MIINEMREALRIVCAALNKHKVEYLLVGGAAVGFYGFQRVSGIGYHHPETKTDLDFWYRPTLENYQRLTSALVEMGVDRSALERRPFDPQHSFLKVPFKTFHTDFMPQMVGLRPFRDCEQDGIRRVLDGNELVILSIEDLIKNKRTLNREIDQKDIEALEKIKRNAGRGLDR
jgi:hypothetical protein